MRTPKVSLHVAAGVQAAELERPKPLLNPDELIRFANEADAAHYGFDSFDWRDEVGRKWTIRPGVKDELGVILIQCSRGDIGREQAIPTSEYSRDAARAAVDVIDQDEVWT